MIKFLSVSLSPRPQRLQDNDPLKGASGTLYYIFIDGHLKTNEIFATHISMPMTDKYCPPELDIPPAATWILVDNT